ARAGRPEPADLTAYLQVRTGDRRHAAALLGRALELRFRAGPVGRAGPCAAGRGRRRGHRPRAGPVRAQLWRPGQRNGCRRPPAADLTLSLERHMEFSLESHFTPHLAPDAGQVEAIVSVGLQSDSDGATT